MQLALYLRKNGMSDLALAKKAGMSSAIICRLLSGQRNVSARTAAKISIATGGVVSVEELLFPQGVPKGARIGKDGE